ncbi:lipoprotein [Flammeovirgaceae bacterium 311]|nr:lipoprotein [Flammeovirgaceae bacterium 311]
MQKTKLHLLLILLLLGGACSSPQSAQTESTTTGAPGYSAEQIAAESQKANDFFERTYNEALDRSPMQQTQLGIKKDQDKWNDISDAFAIREHEILQANLQYLRDSINEAALDASTRLSYKIWEEQATKNINAFQYRHYSYPVNQMFGWQSIIPAFLINFHQITNEADARAYIARLSKLNGLMDEVIENVKQNEEHGAVLPKFLFPLVLSDSRNVISGAPFDNSNTPSPLLEDFQKKVNAVQELNDSQKKALVQEATQALNNSVRPAYEKLISFLTEQEKRAPMEEGVWRFEQGADYFNTALKATTTTNLTADEIHEIGLREVARIEGEMKQIMQQVGFTGTLQEFFTYTKEDPRFYYPDTQEGRQQYLDSATVIINNMRDQLDELFLTKPKADMIVKAVEPFREKSAGKAFYSSPAPDGSRPGIYYANLYNIKAMPKWEMEALAYHEGIPGHHMQLAIAQELEGIPKFRRFGGFTAYSEGWGLYCELLPKEIGAYQDPYSDFGRLNMEMWRACRLVVDTGIHSKKWSRQQGLDYYRAHASAPESEIASMVDRHIVMPSQATAYKIGMMKILELRESAKQELGSRFDIREFHDVVLTNGAVPLSLLEEMVDQWVARKKS